MNRTKWRPVDIQELKELCAKDYPDERIAAKLNMTLSAIKIKKRQLGLNKKRTIDWTQEKVDFIEDLNKKGYNSREIAEAFTEKFQFVTRNSIIGKLNRKVTQRRVHVQKKAPPPKEIEKAYMQDIEGGIPLFDAKPNQCRFPFSTGAKMRVCGLDCVAGVSYCQEHKERCYQPIKSRKETDKAKKEHKEKFFDENTVI